MAASRDDVNRWIKTARKKKAMFIISACDTYDFEDYPKYCEDFEALTKGIKEVENASMQRVNEIIFINPNDGIAKENITISQALEMLKEMQHKYEVDLMLFISIGFDSLDNEENIIPLRKISDSTSYKEALKDAVGDAIELACDTEGFLQLEKIIIKKCKKI